MKQSKCLRLWGAGASSIGAWVRRLGVGVVIACASALVAGEPPPVSPPVPAPLADAELPGPFPVGVTTYTFYDHSRLDTKTQEPRGIKTEIWYPATDDSRGLPRNRLSDFLDRGTNPQLAALASLALGVPVSELDERFHDVAARDARVRDGRFPLILFSHGSGAVRTQSVFWCEHMASHGYVVAAPDHAGSALATTVGGRIVFADRSQHGAEASREDRPRDLRFLLDAIGRLDRGDDSRFAGRCATDRVGVAGHSFSAESAVALGDADPRVKAISPWASCGPLLTRGDLPVLLLLATEDVALTAQGIRACREWFESVRGARVLVEFKNAGHNSFTEVHQFRPDAGDGVGSGLRITDGQPLTYVRPEVARRYVNGFTLAFFDRHLKDVAARDSYLARNPEPGELEVRARNPDQRR